jgi:hypothetical protein
MPKPFVSHKTGGRLIMIEGRIVIIPFLQGIVNADGTVTKPDIDGIFKKWLERHPEFDGPERERPHHVTVG